MTRKGAREIRPTENDGDLLFPKKSHEKTLFLTANFLTIN